MTSLRSHLLAWSIRHLLRPGLDGARPVEAIRRHVANFTRIARLPAGLTSEDQRIGGRPALHQYGRQARKDRAILYFHGGAYVFGSPQTHRSLTGQLAQSAGCRVISVDYRLAPENPAPAALEDAREAYSELCTELPPEQIVIAGDSAGGGLALALAQQLQQEQQPRPAGLLLFCPWGDLRLQNDSLTRNRDNEPMLSKDGLAMFAEYYAAGADLSLPHLSPALGEFAGLPPMYVQAAGHDLLLDDAREIVKAARAAQVSTKLDVFAELFHDFMAVPEWVPEGRRALVIAGAWVKSVCA